MAFSTERIKKYRRWFIWLFVLSLVMFLLLWGARNEAPPDGPKNGGGDFNILVVGSLLTSCATLIGMLVTTIVMWRKERRESEHATIDLEKNKLELEKLREEISAKNAAAQNKRKMTKRRRGV
jgi:hypothetical protein